MLPGQSQNTPMRANPWALKAGMGLTCLTTALMGFDVWEELSAPDVAKGGADLIEEGLEIISVLGLALFTLYLFRLLMRMSRDAAEREQTLSLLRGEFGAVLDAKFAQWGLTPAERDVTMLMLKGLSVAEIAAAREVAAGTVKAQSTAIFRKVGVASKSALLSVIIDEFLDSSEAAQQPVERLEA